MKLKVDIFFQEIKIIHQRLDEIQTTISKTFQPIQLPAENDLFTLEDHLRRTYLTVAKKGNCCAKEVSLLTGESRANASLKLNVLCRLGWLKKQRNSQTVTFSLKGKQKK